MAFANSKHSTAPIHTVGEGESSYYYGRTDRRRRLPLPLRRTVVTMAASTPRRPSPMAFMAPLCYCKAEGAQQQLWSQERGLWEIFWPSFWTSHQQWWLNSLTLTWFELFRNNKCSKTFERIIELGGFFVKLLLFTYMPTSRHTIMATYFESIRDRPMKISFAKVYFLVTTTLGTSEKLSKLFFKTQNQFLYKPDRRD